MLQRLGGIRQNVQQHDQKENGVASQNAQMPDLVIAEVRRVWIGFAIGKDQRTDGVKKTARNEQVDRVHPKLMIDGTDQKNNDPAHEQKADV